jgi:hypothetical protein
VADTLTNAQVPQGIAMLPGAQQAVSVNLINGNNQINNSLPDVTYSWQIASGSGVSIVGSSTGRTVTISASSTGSAVLRVTVEQGATLLQQTSFFIRDTTVAVNAVPPTPVPTTAPTNPGTPPVSIPNSLAVVAPESALLVNKSGVQTGSSAQGTSLNQGPVIFIRKGSVTNFYGISVTDADISSLSPLPAGVRIGSSAANFTFVNASGQAQTSFRLLVAAEVCLPATQADLSAGFQAVSIYRYNVAAGQWVKLNTTYNAITKQFCASSSNFSTFAIGVEQVVATPTPSSGNNLPVTGGWSPTSGLLIFAGLVGFVLLGGGAMTMRRARKFESE